MRNKFTFSHQPAQQSWTVAGLSASKGKLRLTDVAAMNARQAARTADTGNDTRMSRVQTQGNVRAAAPNTLVTATLSTCQTAVRSGAFPYEAVSAQMKPCELKAFRARLAETGPLGAEGKG